jgi:hypothetical protein
MLCSSAFQLWIFFRTIILYSRHRVLDPDQEARRLESTLNPSESPAAACPATIHPVDQHRDHEEAIR